MTAASDPERTPPPRFAARSKAWVVGLARKHTPSREELAANRFLAPVAHRVLSPELWRFTRRSVPRGVALGLFAAFILPIGQILISTFLALPTRANVPLAALVTFITNPFTLPFWLVVANRTGEFVLQWVPGAPAVVSAEAASGTWSSLAGAFALAGTTLVGYLVLSLVVPLIGWVVAGWVWRALVSRRRARRLRAMEARLDRQLGPR